MNRRSTPRSLLWIAPILLALVTTGYAACVTEEQPDLEAFTLRDALGLTPDWVKTQPSTERERLRQRMTTAATDQADDSAWIEVPPELAAHDDVRTDLGPRRALQQLDESLVQLDRDPLIIQWSELDADGPVARACPLEEADLIGPLGADSGQWAAGWTVDDAFDVPLAGGSRTERAALDALRPRLERWIARCAEAAGPDLAPEGEHTRMEVVRAESAPTLVAWWPGLRQVHVNPLLLMLFEDKDALHLAVRGQALIASDLFQTCVDDLSDFCERCGDVDATGVAGCEDTLLNGGTPAQSCRQLQVMTQGYAQFCVNHLLFNQRTLDICVADQVTSADCLLETPTRSLVSLDGRYLRFVQSPACLGALDYCTAGYEPRPDDTVPPDDFVDDSSGTGECCQALGETGCYVGEACAESGALDSFCADFADGACSDCGDSGSSDCGGCEGDTY